jgi:hypothetical protein
MRIITCLALLLAFAAGSSQAQVPELSLCHFEMEPYAALVFTLPDGSGSPFTEAIGPQGPADATLTLTVVDANGNPIANYPAANIWLEAQGVVACSGIHPDGDTDEFGQTRWSVSPLAGGSNWGMGSRIVINGELHPLAVALTFISADMNGDGFVNLVDVGLFVAALETNTLTADFNGDGAINLGDVSMLAQAMGATCQ